MTRVGTFLQNKLGYLTNTMEMSTKHAKNFYMGGQGSDGGGVLPISTNPGDFL